MSGSEVLLKLDAGDYLALLQDNQENGYYHAQLFSGGPAGWVYRTFVRRHPGSAPPTESPPSDPLKDSTLHLTAEQLTFAARHLTVGKPQAVYERVKEGYVTAVDARLKIPLWIQYQLTVDDLDGSGERRDNFHADTSIPRNARARPSDYVGSGYDRGHMAPAGDMVRSQRVMDESFPMSNMAPQVGVGFNQRIWKNLEDAIRGWVEQRGTLTVITGPVFTVSNGRVQYEVIGGNRVAVPTAFYKIVVHRNGPGTTEVLAFLMPNENLGDSDYSEFLTSVDAIEEATGLDFLSALPDDEERRAEGTTATVVW